MIRRSVLLLAFLLLLAPALRGEHNRSSVQGRHFFQPSRTLFFFRPDLYVRLHSAQSYPLYPGDSLPAGHATRKPNLSSGDAQVRTL